MPTEPRSVNGVLIFEADNGEGVRARYRTVAPVQTLTFDVEYIYDGDGEYPEIGLHRSPRVIGMRLDVHALVMSTDGGDGKLAQMITPTIPVDREARDAASKAFHDSTGDHDGGAFDAGWHAAMRYLGLEKS